MQVGDLGFFYHSQTEKAVVGIVEVCAEAHPDSTTDDAAGFEYAPQWPGVRNVVPTLLGHELTHLSISSGDLGSGRTDGGGPDLFSGKVG